MANTPREQAIELCQQLIQINTSNPPGDELKAATFCKSYLESIGFDTQLIQHTENRASLVAMLKGMPNSDTFLFVGHLDTVPPGDLSFWDTDPYSGFTNGLKIFGRGAADMKGGLTALLQASCSLKYKKVTNNIIIAMTADEESGSLGANALLDLPEVQNSKMVLIPEPTSNNIGIAEKGALWIKIASKGKSAHGSMPDLGINAIDEIIAIINSLDFSSFLKENHDYLGSFSYSINTISGGIKTNIIPDKCEITIDLRTLPSQNHVEILNLLNGYISDTVNRNPDYHYELKTIIDKPGIESEITNTPLYDIVTIIEKKNSSCRKIGLDYYTDGAVLIPSLNVPFLIFGPGDPSQAHKTNESLDIEKLLHSCEIYTSIMQNLVSA